MLAGENNQLIRSLHTKIDRVLTDQRFVVQTLALSAEKNGFDISPPPSRPYLFLGSGYRARKNANGLTSNISIELLLFLHRTICFDVPAHEVGALRTREVILSRADSSPPEAIAKPPSPAELPSLLSELCDEWNDKHSKSDGSNEQEKIAIIAWFHVSLLKIHPFIDGNSFVLGLRKKKRALKGSVAS